MMIVSYFGVIYKPIEFLHVTKGGRTIVIFTLCSGERYRLHGLGWAGLLGVGL